MSADSSATPSAVPDRLYEGYVFDPDGTAYPGDELLPGTKRLVERPREPERSSSSPITPQKTHGSARRNPRLRASRRRPGVVNTVVTTTRWLLENHPDATVFPIAGEPLMRAFGEAGTKTPEKAEEIDIVASYDRTLEYRKLRIAFAPIR